MCFSEQCSESTVLGCSGYYPRVVQADTIPTVSFMVSYTLIPCFNKV
jgi:hypothetical protein